MATIKVPAGINGIPTTLIPDDPAQFPAWFKSVFIPRWLANADIRNAIQGAGITITGTPGVPATVSADTKTQGLFAQPYVLVGAPVAPTVLTDYRSIAAQASVLSLTDGGATGSLTVSVVTNGIGNTQLRQGAAVSVIGNSTASLANVADIVSAGNLSVLHEAGGVLTFSTIDHTFISDFSSAVPQSANPASQVSLTAHNGSAVTFMRSDASPPLDVSISPTWTGNHTFAPASGVAVTIDGVTNLNALTVTAAASFSTAGIYAAVINGATTSGKSNGLQVNAGTTSGDICVELANAAATLNYMVVFGDGHVWLGPNGGTSGITIDASGNLTALNSTTLTTGVQLGTTAAKTVGFYGTTPAAQRATNTAHSSTNAVSSSAYNSTANQKTVAILQEVMNTLFTIGIWADH